MEKVFDRAAMIAYLKTQLTDRMVKAIGSPREMIYQAWEHADDSELLMSYMAARGAQSRNRALQN
jgi:hypothetical protein